MSFHWSERLIRTPDELPEPQYHVQFAPEGFIGLHEERLTEPANAGMTDDGVQQMLELAERLRIANGGELDESAILAVSEATGSPVEYVRLAVRLRPEEKKKGFLHRLKSEYLGLEPEMRRNVTGGMLGITYALCSSIDMILPRSFFGLLGVLQILCAASILYLATTAKDARSAALTGAITGSLGFIAATVFHAAFATQSFISPALILPITFGTTLASMITFMLVSKNRNRLGLKDPVVERQVLLKQLVDLQAKLKTGEQAVTFMSVDIVGSTKMKETADPLSIEYTFNEYHQFLDRIVRKHGGSIHSTAGDGMTCAFDTPLQAFAAAKNIMTGLIELNAYGNQTGIPIVLRAGIHSGNVLPPKPGDIGSLNFAHVIDISAHMQKAAPIGGIAVSDAAASALPGGPASVGSERIETQGMGGVAWVPRRTVVETAVLSPPPFDPKIVHDN